VTVNGKLNTDPEHYRKNVKAIKVKVIDRDLNRDLAILRLESIPAGVQALKRAAASVEPGDLLRTVGSPAAGQRGTVGDGRRRGSACDAAPSAGRIGLEVESNIPTNGGNSAGAIVNDHGEVVAVHRAARTDAINVSIHIDITEVNAFLKEALPLIDAKTAAKFLARRRTAHQGLSASKLAQADLTEAIKLDPKTDRRPDSPRIRHA